MRTFLKLILPVLALFVLAVVAPFAMLAILIRAVFVSKEQRPYVYVSEATLRIAVSLDHTGNVVGKDLFNALCRKKGGYDFGKYGETISKVLGLNRRSGTLTDAGRALANFLDWLDKDHIDNSIGPI